MPANRIALLREAANLTRESLAERLGVTERTVYRWERGEVQIPDEQKLALSTLFSVTVGFLMGWEQLGDGENGDNAEDVA